MNILALTWKHPQDPTAGGAERYLVEVTSRWAQAGHAVTIFGPRCPVVPGRTGPGIPIGIKYIGSGSRLTVFRLAQAHLRTNGTNYDAVLDTVSTRPFLAHRVVGRKTVVLYHQTAEEVWSQEFPVLVAALGRLLVEPWWIRSLRGAFIVANSPSTASALERFGTHVQGVVPPGCDVPAELHLRERPSAAPRLLWIGRMVSTKRPEDAISGHALLRERIPKVSLDMVGAGYLNHKLSVRRLPGVRVRGPVPEREKRALLAQADLLLVPGTREGWGIVAMEAAAYGVPVIAYNVPGLRDAVVDGETGLLVDPNPAALARAAHKVLSSPHLWSRLSQGGRERALQYSWDTCASQLLEYLSRSPSALGKSAGGGASSLTRASEVRAAPPPLGADPVPLSRRSAAFGVQRQSPSRNREFDLQ